MLQSQFGITSRQVFTGGVAYDQYALSTSRYGDGYDSYYEWLQLGETKPGSCVLFGGGTAASPLSTALSGKKFGEFYTKNTYAGGDSRGLYWRHYIAGAGQTGDAARLYATVLDVAAAGGFGAHISLDFGSTGTITGLGVAGRNTLHLPDNTPVGGTLTALQAEIYSDGAASDPAGSLVSFIRIVNDGHANGKADVDDDVFLFELSGFTAGSGHMFDSTVNSVGAQIDHTFKIRLPNGATGYIPIMDNADGS